MNKNYIIGGVIAIVAFVIGLTISKCTTPEIGIIDLKKIGSEAEMFKQYKQEQDAQEEQLAKWVSKVQKEIANAKTDKKRKELIEKYSKEEIQKREEIQNVLGPKIKENDEKIRALIKEEAESKGLSAVVLKDVVMFGGVDITEDVIKQAK